MRILITAGPTREYLDPVRYLSNASSGKMGFAIAAEAARRGHRVILISGPVDRPDPPGVRVIRVEAAREMLRHARRHFRRCDAAVMAAAVCDYRPLRRSPRKMKKEGRVRMVRLTPTQDIAARLGRVKGKRILVGFALEDRGFQRNAEEKLRKKCFDAIVLNRPAALGADCATVQTLRRDTGWQPALTGSKNHIARTLVNLLESLVL